MARGSFSGAYRCMWIESTVGQQGDLESPWPLYSCSWMELLGWGITPLFIIQKQWYMRSQENTAVHQTVGDLQTNTV